VKQNDTSGCATACAPASCPQHTVLAQRTLLLLLLLLLLIVMESL
jgi:hypothetical protein